MKKLLILALGSALLGSLSQAQSADSQAGGSASQDTSVSTGQSGAQADSKTGVSAQQQGKASEAAPAASGQLATGSMIYAELSKSIDAKKAKQGDEVVAKAQQAVLSQGKVLIPKGSKIVGHVTQVKPHEKDQPQSELGIAFDHAVLKDGTQVPLGSVAIQAIAPPQASAGIAGQNDTTAGASSGMPSSNNPGMGYPSGSGRMGSGNNNTVGQVGSTVGGVADTAGNTAGRVAGTASTTATGGAGGHLNGSSRGVVGISGLSLSAGASNSGSVITSDNKNVKLESGTEMVLKVQ